MASGYSYVYTNSLVGSPLYFFYDCEATGNVIEEDRIIEVAAVLYTKSLVLSPGKIEDLVRSGDHFQSLCHCTKEILPVVEKLIKLTLADLRGEPLLSTVLDQFFDWIKEKVTKVEEATRRKYTPVLVAHSGNVLDYPLLMLELDRLGQRSLTEKYKSLNLHFVDTFSMCKHMQARSHPLLRGLERFGLGSLYKFFFPYDPFDAHRALADARILLKIFTDSPLASIIDVQLQDAIQSEATTRELWKLRKAGIFSPTKEKELLKKGITVETLEAKRRVSVAGLRLYLREIGINKPGPVLKEHFKI